MRIKKIHIDHFGALSDFDYSFSDGCTIFCKTNGWGKTTLSVFLRVMFYGFSKKGRGPRERALYKPWDGGNYGGSLTFETAGKEYTILRTFGDVKTGRDDRLQMIDELTGKSTSVFSEIPGETLFGINEDSFLRTACMMQEDCSTDANSDITSRVGAETGEDALLDDVKKYDEISRMMNEQLNHLSDTKSTGKIYRKKQEILRLEMAVRKGISLDDAIGKLEKAKEDENTAFSELEEKLKQLSDSQSEYSILQDSIAKQEQYLSLLQEVQKRRETRDSCSAAFPEGVPDPDLLLKLIRANEDLGKLEEREKLSAFFKEDQSQFPVFQNKFSDQSVLPKHLHKQKVRSFILAAIGIILLTAGLLIGFPRTAAGSFLFPAGLSVAVFGIMSCISAVTNHSDRTIISDDLTEKSQQHDKAVEQLEGLRELLYSGILSMGYQPEEQIHQQLLQIRLDTDRAETAEREYQNAEQNLQTFLKNNPGIRNISHEIIPDHLQSITSMEELTHHQFQLQEQERKIRDRIDQYDQQILTLLDERQELSGKEEKLLRMREQLKELEEQQWLIRTTSSIMSAARDSYAARYMDPVRKAFEKYYQIIDPQLKEELIIDADYSVHVKGGGILRETDVLSRGYRNLASLCLRLALLETMYKKETPFLILDDPFLYFDDDKYKRSMCFLTEIAGQFQVILFTCSAERTKI